MKKFFKIYVNGYPGASELRTTLMACTTSDQVLTAIEPYIGTNSQ
jgi:tRNA-dihydrouridine synthase